MKVPLGKKKKKKLSKLLISAVSNPRVFQVEGDVCPDSNFVVQRQTLSRGRKNVSNKAQALALSPDFNKECNRCSVNSLLADEPGPQLEDKSCTVPRDCSRPHTPPPVPGGHLHMF